MKEELVVVVTIIRREKIDRDVETFTDFLYRIRKKYNKAMHTRDIGIKVITPRKRRR